MEILIVFLVIVCITVLAYWALTQAGVPPIVPVLTLCVGLLIALLYLAGNADRIDLDADDKAGAWLQRS